MSLSANPYKESVPSILKKLKQAKESNTLTTKANDLIIELACKASTAGVKTSHIAKILKCSDATINRWRRSKAAEKPIPLVQVSTTSEPKENRQNVRGRSSQQVATFEMGAIKIHIYQK